MSSKDNLIPFNKRTEEERRKIAIAGGKASGEARRRKKTLKEAADYYLSLPVKSVKKKALLEGNGVDPENIDNQMAIIAGLVETASLGDPRAAKVLFAFLGEDARRPDGGVILADDIS